MTDRKSIGSRSSGTGAADTRGDGVSRRAFVAGSAALCVAATVPARAFADRARGPLLVELFTSQGCSSCPPADSLLTDLCERQDVFALSIHVDYWDYIGWADPFADPANTKVQRAYARTFGRRTIYTPQMVIGGLSEGVGSRRRDMQDKIREALAHDGPGAEVRLDPVGRSIEVEPIGTTAASADICVVTFDRQHQTIIKRGENRGRTLTYSHVQRSRRKLAQWLGSPVRIPLPSDVAANEDRGIGVIVQTQEAGPVLGTAMYRPWVAS